MDSHSWNLELTLPHRKALVPARYITTYDEARSTLESLHNPDVLYAIDTETRPLAQYKMIPDAALSPHLSCVRLLQLSDGERVYVFDMDRIGDEKLFVPFLQQNRFIAHYALFDLQFFSRMGVVNMNIGCTQILARLIYSATIAESSFKSATLEALMKALFGVDISKNLQASSWGNEDLTFEQVEYAAYDPLYCFEVAQRMAPSLKKYGLSEVYKLYKAAQHPLVEMQLCGLKVDQELHRKMIDDWRRELYEAKILLQDKFQLPVISSTSISAWLNTHLPAETLTYWPKTPTGLLSTDAKTFQDYDHLPIVGPFAEFQKKKTLSSTFGSALLQRINPATKRLHCHYNIAGARTGRLSSSEPNLQNFPASTAMRRIFIPEEGWVFVCADYSQIEVRVAAELSGDPVLKGVYERGEDIYRFTASQVYRCRLKDVTELQRKACKPLVLGNLYGIGVTKYARSVGIEEDEARRQIYQFRDTYKILREWQIEQARIGEDTLQARTVLGKIRALEPENTYGAAMNVPVQGTSAEIMLIALVELKKSIGGFGAHIVNCVHDEILVEARPINVDRVMSLVENCMISGYKKVIPNGCIRGLVSINSGATWGDAKA